MLDKLNPGAGFSTKCVPTSTTTPAPRAWPPQKITGLNLAKGRRTKAQRIGLAEAIHAGKVEVTKPTLKQSAALSRVSIADVYRARKPKHIAVDEAVAAWRSWTPQQRSAFGRGAGIAELWDNAIIPVMDEERGEVRPLDYRPRS